MSTKQLNGLLVLLIVCIYFYAYQLIMEDSNDEISAGNIATQSITSNSLYTFKAHWVDPFRSKKIIVRKPKVVVEKPKPAPIVRKPIVYLPQFRITGSIKKQSEIQLSVNMNNKNHFISVSDMLNGMEFKRITKDSLNILYKDSLFKVGYKL